MRKRQFVRMTLANGKKPVIIRPEHIAFAMALENTDETGETTKFTRIVPQNIIIDQEANWLDVVETPDEIADMIR